MASVKIKKQQFSKQKRAYELSRSPWSFMALVDQFFLIFAGIASIWLAWLVWREGWQTGGWWLVGLFFVGWVVTAYLALPRLHRILSSFYVPNYFMGRTKTSDGLLSDPINVALRGSEAQLHKAMTDAGWTLADEVTAHSAWKIIISTLMRRSYNNAPVSSLFLFGRRQDFAYQQEVDGSPGKRHHVRFWRCPKGWLLPGGHAVDWLAAGTYDRSVGLSLFTFQITHKIEEDIDIERDYIVRTVTQASKRVGVTVLKDFSSGYHSRNGGGDSIRTDGDLPVLELDRVLAKDLDDVRLGVILDTTLHDSSDESLDTFIYELWSRRPPQILFGSILVVATLSLTATSIIADLIDWRGLVALSEASFRLEGMSLSDANNAAIWFVGSTVAAGVFLVVIELVLVMGVLRGSNRARLILLAAASFVIVAESLSVTIGKMSWATVGLLLTIGLRIAMVLMFSSDSARMFTHSRSKIR